MGRRRRSNPKAIDGSANMVGMKKVDDDDEGTSEKISKTLPAAKPSWKSVLLSTPPSSSSEIISKRIPAAKPSWKSVPLSTKTTKFNNRGQQVTTTIDDYKLLVFEYGSQSRFPFRTFSLNEALPTCFPTRGTNRPFPDPDINPKLLASLDGLVCVAFELEDVWKLQFVNPSTGDCKDLPSFPAPLHCPYGLTSTDPVSFYFDSSSRDYKLLWFLGSGFHGAFVYSRRSDSWKEIEFSVIPDNNDVLYGWSPPIFHGQCIYFEGLFDGLKSGYPFNWFSRIICFDVKTETFREISVPHRLPPSGTAAKTSSMANLVLLDGCLHMYLYYNNTAKKLPQVEHRVGLWRLIKDDYGLDDWLHVEAFTGWSEKDRHDIWTVSIGNWLAVLDADDNSFKKMSTQDFKTRYHHFSTPSFDYCASRMLYVPTRVSP